MTISQIASVSAYGLSIIGFLLMAMTFGLRKEWEPWHGDAVEKDWDALDGRIQLVILSIMRVMAAASLALCVACAALLWMLLSGVASMRWILPLVLLTFAFPAATIAVLFKIKSAINPPLAPALVGAGLPIIGFLFSVFDM